MQKVVLDTNVLVSALIQRSYPYLILNELFLEQRFQLCVSDEVLAEYHEVLSRPKFARFADFFVRANALLTEVENRAVHYTPTIRLSLISDPDDNMILELADVCKANFVVTGNTTDFTFPVYKNTQIVGPKEYWESHQLSR